MTPAELHLIRRDTVLSEFLPAVAAPAAASSRLLHDRRMVPLWQHLVEMPELEIAACPAPGRVPLVELGFECDAGRARAIVATDDAAFALVVATADDEGLRALALEALLAFPLAALSSSALSGLHIATVRPFQASVPAAGWAAWRRGDGESFRFVITQLDALLAERLVALRQPQVVPVTAPAVRATGRVRVGRRRLRIDSLASLRSGDVLLLGAGGSPARLHLGSPRARALCAPCIVDGHVATLQGDFQMQEQDIAEHSAFDQSETALDDLEIDVHFELETVTIPVGDIRAMKPGYIIDLASQASEARVRLVTGGVVIGEAELVTVADHLGARIVHLVEAHDA